MLNTIDGGTTWAEVSSGTIEDLADMYFTGSLTGYVAGGGGSILKTTHGTTVSIQEPRSQQSGIMMFPNPAHDRISIGINGKVGEDVLIRIFTVTGKQVMHHEFCNRRQFQLDVSSLLKGVYLVVIETTLGRETRKLVKL